MYIYMYIYRDLPAAGACALYHLYARVLYFLYWLGAGMTVHQSNIYDYDDVGTIFTHDLLETLSLCTYLGSA